MVKGDKFTIYLPVKEKATGTSVIICPRGRYGILVMEREGHDIAKKFAEQGITAFVLKYRLPSDRIMVDKSIGPLQDAQQAIRTLRTHAVEWNLQPNKIGIMGFSAGGHHASTAGTHFMQRTIDIEGEISLRPDFMILVYPVISFSDSIGNKGTSENRLGQDSSKDQVLLFSNETQVTSKTPPALLRMQVMTNLYRWQTVLHFVMPFSLHVYSKGGHGYFKNPHVTYG